MSSAQRRPERVLRRGRTPRRKQRRSPGRSTKAGARAPARAFCGWGGWCWRSSAQRRPERVLRRGVDTAQMVRCAPRRSTKAGARAPARGVCSVCVIPSPCSAQRRPERVLRRGPWACTTGRKQASSLNEGRSACSGAGSTLPDVSVGSGQRSTKAGARAPARGVP